MGKVILACLSNENVSSLYRYTISYDELTHQIYADFTGSEWFCLYFRKSEEKIKNKKKETDSFCANKKVSSMHKNFVI